MRVVLTGVLLAAIAAYPSRSDQIDNVLTLSLPHGMQMAFDSTSGNLTSITFNGVQFLSQAFTTPLVQLALTRPTDLGGPLIISSNEYCNIEGSSIVVDGYNAVQFKFTNHSDHFGKMPSGILATIVANSTSNKMHFKLEINNTGGSWAVQYAKYPGMIQSPFLDSNSSDELLIPFGEGGVLPNPSGAVQQSSPNQGFYPRDCPVQFTARSGGIAGLYMATEDGTGQVKQFQFQSQFHQFVRMELLHYQGEVVGEDFIVPYDTVVTTYAANGSKPTNWRHAAKIYKDWTLRQPWTKTKLSNRTDIPPILLSGAAGIIGGIQGADGYSATNMFGPQLEKLPAYIAQYKQRLGGTNLLFIPYGWENRGTWAGVNYFPAIPSSSAWSKISKILSTSNDGVMLLISGFWWVVKRGNFSGGPPFDDSDQLPSRMNMLIKAYPNGTTPWERDDYAPGSKQPWRGLSVSLCHGDANSTQLIAALVSQANQIGASVVSFDQEIGGGQSAPCYDPKHSHRPGYGSYMWEGMKQTMVQALNSASAENRSLGLSTEQTSELSIPYSATYWSRQFGVTDYPFFNVRSVGLFSYLYHEFVTACGAAIVQGQGVMGSQPDYTMRVTAMANVLTRGLIAVPFNIHVDFTKEDDWHRNVTAAFFSYFAVPKYYKEWLVYGTTQPPIFASCQNVSTWFYRGSMQNLKKTNWTVPAVVSGTFTNANGGYATIFASVSPTTENATVSLADYPSPAKILTLFDKKRVQVSQWQYPFPDTIDIEFDSYGVLVLADGS